MLSRRGEAHPLPFFEFVQRVNVTGTFNVMRLATKRMAALPALADRAGERGCIVNTASVAAYDGQQGQAAYSASKGAVVAMIRKLFGKDTEKMQ